MSFAAKLGGDLRSILADELAQAEAAITSGVGDAAEGLKAELRQQISAAGLGTRLANSWRSQVYPKGATSLRAAGVVYSNAPDVVGAFDEGAVIRSANGFWLAIPTPTAGTGARGKRMNPALWEQMHGVPLRFVFRRAGPSLLVADNMRERQGKRGGFAKGSAAAQRTGHGMASVVIFLLVPQVSLKKRLDIAAAAEKWADAVPELVIRNWRYGGGG